MKELHVVLGASGTTGYWVIQALQSMNKTFAAVSRSKTYKDIENRQGNLLDPLEAREVLRGASHVYLCVGVPYNRKLWETQWPIIMSNVIDACAEIGARIIFLDNIYMYGPHPLPVKFDENMSQRPTSKKGKIRKLISDMLLDAHRSGKVKAVIGRSADFYGPKTTYTPLYTSFLENILQGKNPGWLGKAHTKHTYSYSPDNGRALVTLALEDSCYGEAWHLPVSAPWTIEEILELINVELGTGFELKFLGQGMQAFLSLFIPILREVRDVGYMFTEDYVMSADKFLSKFPDFEVTRFEEGMKEMIRDLQRKE
jgi:nucleoside-diphosphate-sugar epimerase